MTTTEFFETFRRLDSEEQGIWIDFSNISQKSKALIAEVNRDNGMFRYLADNPQVNSRYLAKSLIGMGGVNVA